MKFIFYALSQLTVIVLCYRFVEVPTEAPSVFAGLNKPEYLLVLQQVQKRAKIMDVINECNQTQPVSYEDGMKMFLPVENFKLNPKTKDAKCMIDCLMRTLGVMNDNGLNEKAYMVDVKQLLYNYTSFEIKKEHTSVFKAIERFGYNYALIEAYEYAAHECKDRREPKNDNCEASLRVSQCIIDKGYEKGFDLPVYPFFSKRKP